MGTIPTILVVWSIAGIFLFIVIVTWYKRPESAITQAKVYIICGPFVVAVWILFRFYQIIRLFIVCPLKYLLEGGLGLKQK